MYFFFLFLLLLLIVLFFLSLLLVLCLFLFVVHISCCGCRCSLFEVLVRSIVLVRALCSCVGSCCCCVLVVVSAVPGDIVGFGVLLSIAILLAMVRIIWQFIVCFVVFKNKRNSYCFVAFSVVDNRGC